MKQREHHQKERSAVLQAEPEAKNFQVENLHDDGLKARLEQKQIRVQLELDEPIEPAHRGDHSELQVHQQDQGGPLRATGEQPA